MASNFPIFNNNITAPAPVNNTNISSRTNILKRIPSEAAIYYLKYLHKQITIEKKFIEPLILGWRVEHKKPKNANTSTTEIETYLGHSISFTNVPNTLFYFYHFIDHRPMVDSIIDNILNASLTNINHTFIPLTADTVIMGILDIPRRYSNSLDEERLNFNRSNTVNGKSTAQVRDTDDSPINNSSISDESSRLVNLVDYSSSSFSPSSSLSPTPKTFATVMKSPPPNTNVFISTRVTTTRTPPHVRPAVSKSATTFKKTPLDTPTISNNTYPLFNTTNSSINTGSNNIKSPEDLNLKYPRSTSSITVTSFKKGADNVLVDNLNPDNPPINIQTNYSSPVVNNTLANSPFKLVNSSSTMSNTYQISIDTGNKITDNPKTSLISDDNNILSHGPAIDDSVIYVHHPDSSILSRIEKLSKTIKLKHNSLRRHQLHQAIIQTHITNNSAPRYINWKLPGNMYHSDSLQEELINSTKRTYLEVTLKHTLLRINELIKAEETAVSELTHIYPNDSEVSLEQHLNCIRSKVETEVTLLQKKAFDKIEKIIFSKTSPRHEHIHSNSNLTLGPSNNHRDTHQNNRVSSHHVQTYHSTQNRYSKHPTTSGSHRTPLEPNNKSSSSSHLRSSAQYTHRRQPGSSMTHPTFDQRTPNHNRTHNSFSNIPQHSHSSFNKANYRSSDHTSSFTSRSSGYGSSTTSRSSGSGSINISSRPSTPQTPNFRQQGGFTYRDRNQINESRSIARHSHADSNRRLSFTSTNNIPPKNSNRFFINSSVHETPVVTPKSILKSRPDDIPNDRYFKKQSDQLHITPPNFCTSFQPLNQQPTFHQQYTPQYQPQYQPHVQQYSPTQYLPPQPPAQQYSPLQYLTPRVQQYSPTQYLQPQPRVKQYSPPQYLQPPQHIQQLQYQPTQYQTPHSYQLQHQQPLHFSYSNLY